MKWIEKEGTANTTRNMDVDVRTIDRKAKYIQAQSTYEVHGKSLSWQWLISPP